ncbi:hypothetical protein D3C71_1758660 [compost metagenome]
MRQQGFQSDATQMKHQQDVKGIASHEVVGCLFLPMVPPQSFGKEHQCECIDDRTLLH